MSKVPFIPGRPAEPRGPLARYCPVQPVQAAGAYVQALTRPGDLVVDLFCQGPTVVRETVTAGRRALGFSVNPLLLVAARLGLGQRDADALNTAFTRLADSPKGDVPLRRHLASLYRSACPACGTAGVAEWFGWDRDGDYPFKKAVRCPKCEGLQEGAPDDEDLRAAHRFQPRGLAYYYALDRVAPLGHPARERATQLVELYTPRNLSALMDLGRRLEGLEAGEEVRIALAGVLLDCFDAGSSLYPYGEERPRPRTLRVPSLYLERNVWLCFEEGLSRLLVEQSPLPPPAPPAPSPALSALSPALPPGGREKRDEEHLHQAEDVTALVRGDAEGYALVGCAARDVGKVTPPGSVALIFADPPRPDGVFWALSALWAGWLWESPAARALRPFLRRRRFDWDWHWRVLQVALKAAGPLLATGGHLVTLFSDPDNALLGSVCLATSSAGYLLEGWGYSPGVGHRLVWRWAPEIADRRSQAAPANVETLEHELMAVAEETVVNTLRERGEPTVYALLHASAYARLAERGLLMRTAAVLEKGGGHTPLALAAEAVRRAFEAAPTVRLADHEGTEGALRWLADPNQSVEPVVSNVEPPLADRVEALVWELLAQRPAWGLEELVGAVYTRFPGPLTPDLALVMVCIDSYSVQEDKSLCLRPEDAPPRRAAELEALRDDLAEFGERLEFKVRRGAGWDVCWLEGGRAVYLFTISATAALGPQLLTGQAVDMDREGQRCLVLPGGRAQLVSLKLQRDPRLAHAVEAGAWQFIKFRHLRRLIVEQELDRHALKTVLGLDPIVEQEAAQIPLF
ncbi:MAG: hypothetical protein ISS49_04075 [Anaerolineae bacterium]|nr:hypothetical protein [Anaerolineae bacterium]